MNLVNDSGIVAVSNLNVSINDQSNATQGMWRCSRIMHHQRELNSNVLTTLEGIVDQLTSLREDWNEEILRQLRLALAKCYLSAFEMRTNVADACFSTQTFQFLRKLIVTYVTDNEIGAADPNAATTQRRSQITVQDLDWAQMKPSFAKDFSFSGSRNLRDLIVKLKKWIKILEAKKNLSPKSWLLDEKSRYLSNFSNQIGDIALFGEFLLPKVGVISISKFMPKIDIVSKQYNSARRFYVRGHNGKIYPYLGKCLYLSIKISKLNFFL